MKIGYARVSTPHQNLDAQISALESAGCEKIFKEAKSSRVERKVLEEMLNFIREDDILIVTKLDRLGRSLKDLIDILHQLQQKNVVIIAIDDNIDTSSKIGKVVFQLFALVAELELTFNKERRERANFIGRKGGRKPALTQSQEQEVITYYQAKDQSDNYIHSLSEIEKMMKVSRPTVYKCLKENNIPLRK